MYIDHAVYRIGSVGCIRRAFHHLNATGLKQVCVEQLVDVAKAGCAQIDTVLCCEKCATGARTG